MTKEMIQAARRADLSAWIIENHPEDVMIEGKRSMRLKDNPSVCIGNGFSGYIDFSSGQSGNTVDFLMEFYGYDFIKAVEELQMEKDNILSSFPSPLISEQRQPPTEDKRIKLPEPVEGMYRQMYAYLTKTRGIPADVVNKLIDEKAIYQERQHNNLIFRSQQNDFAEIRGTLSLTSFHGVVAGSNPEGFWWFKSEDQYSRTERAFICEAGIDAMSLYAIHKMQLADAKAEGNLEQVKKLAIPTLYTSIAGVGNRRKVEAILKGYSPRPVFLAVDNDPAGDELRSLFPDMPSVIPEHKDWNEDLIANVTKYSAALPSLGSAANAIMN